jgi:hypothetical protein
VFHRIRQCPAPPATTRVDQPGPARLRAKRPEHRPSNLAAKLPAGSPTLLRGELAALKYADAHYGAFESGEVMHIAVITPRVTRVYLVLYYERAPLWAWFDLYQTRRGNQVISDVFFSPKVQVILPAELMPQ